MIHYGRNKEEILNLDINTITQWKALNSMKSKNVDKKKIVKFYKVALSSLALSFFIFYKKKRLCN
jgi:hypothetical protein